MKYRVYDVITNETVAWFKDGQRADADETAEARNKELKDELSTDVEWVFEHGDE